ncbi:4-amino-4-deoxy-L-arabinose-phosphoundecaprenol flippase subunit ArnF [Mangrovitalea sediminis]|uniref:4-amino-4-deoxy-L-arabinose-phosphoundecaprenol flippase subunit ArnF n=1 Tax=Mangrovitalea sediminis TaxID=1982043 RepID=UPI000BE4B728|nr:4-amino-4-deoxy-L-arabinose-phosphoundecaprenol flippase subunit ArnF [Mangrovitalea sediminis]
MRGYLFAGASILLTTYAQLAMKWGMSHLPPLHDLLAILSHWQAHLGMLLLVFSGLVAYAASLGCWMAALHDLPLNRAYPLLSISYALVYLVAGALPWFNEPYSMIRSLGVGLIVVGVVLINQRRPA